MQPTRNDDQTAETNPRMEDLAPRSEEVQSAEQVRGGFDPQPEPPARSGPPLVEKVKLTPAWPVKW